MSLELHNRVTAEVARLWEVARNRYSVLNHHAAPDISLDIRGTCAGKATYKVRNGIRHYLVRFNPTLLRENREDFIARTVPHEIAHIIEYILFNKAGHGPNWKGICATLGMRDITRCHSFDVSNAQVRKVRRLEVSCACQGTRTVSSVIFNRMKRGRNYTCNTCHARLKFLEDSSCTPQKSC